MQVESLDGRIGLRPNPSDPTTIMQSDLPQVGIEEWDAPIKKKLGRCEGPVLDSTHIEMMKGNGIVIFSSPEQTQFVRVSLEDGVERMEAYDPRRHGEWNAIPDTGLTPAQLLVQLLGFGTEEINQGQQFERTRKAHGGASRGNWKVDHHPKIHKKK